MFYFLLIVASQGVLTLGTAVVLTDTGTLLKFKRYNDTCMPNKKTRKKEKKHIQQLQTKDGPINKRSFKNIKTTLG